MQQDKLKLKIMPVFKVAMWSSIEQCIVMSCLNHILWQEVKEVENSMMGEMTGQWTEHEPNSVNEIPRNKVDLRQPVYYRVD